MPVRARRFVAAVGMLAFLTFWIWGAVTLSTRLPDNFLIELLFYAVAGTCWGLPLFPMLKWAERG